jgi:hypothetical protein
MEKDGAHSAPSLASALAVWCASFQFRRIVLISGTIPASVPIGFHQIDRPDPSSFATLTGNQKLRNLSFGDYGIMSPDWREPSGGSGGPPAYYRYTTIDRWLLFKDVNGQGQNLAKLIVMNAHYRGEGYSPGDAAIFKRAKQILGVGNATNQICESASQHIVFAVNQLR